MKLLHHSHSTNGTPCSPKRDLRFGAIDENLEHYSPPITP